MDMFQIPLVTQQSMDYKLAVEKNVEAETLLKRMDIPWIFEGPQISPDDWGMLTGEQLCNFKSHAMMA